MTEDESRLRSNISYIRKTLDSDVVNCDIQSVQDKLIALTQLSGLASECKGHAKRFLEEARLAAAQTVLKSGVTGNLAMLQINGMCANEHGLYEYADRICSSITTTCDSLRSVISLHKSEMERINSGQL